MKLLVLFITSIISTNLLCQNNEFIYNEDKEHSITYNFLLQDGFKAMGMNYLLYDLFYKKGGSRYIKSVEYSVFNESYRDYLDNTVRKKVKDSLSILLLASKEYIHKREITYSTSWYKENGYDSVPRKFFNSIEDYFTGSNRFIDSIFISSTLRTYRDSTYLFESAKLNYLYNIKFPFSYSNRSPVSITLNEHYSYSNRKEKGFYAGEVNKFREDVSEYNFSEWCPGFNSGQIYLFDPIHKWPDLPTLKRSPSGVRRGNPISIFMDSHPMGKPEKSGYFIGGKRGKAIYIFWRDGNDGPDKQVQICKTNLVYNDNNELIRAESEITAENAGGTSIVQMVSEYFYDKNGEIREELIIRDGSRIKVVEIKYTIKNKY